MLPTVPDSDALSGAHAALFLVALSLSIYVATLLQRRKDDNLRYPPYAPGSIAEHIRMSTSARYPWWVLDVAQRLDARVFRLKIPLAPLSHKVVIGDPDTFRQVMQDPLSTKPLAVYRAFRRVHGGSADTATAFTSNGAVWHAKRTAVAPAFASKHVKRMTQLAMEFTETWMRETLESPAADEGSVAANAEGGEDAHSPSFDVAEDILGIVLSAISETALEYKMSAEEKAQFGRDVEASLVEFASLEPLQPWRQFVGLCLPHRRRAFAAARNIKQLVSNIMASYRRLEAPTSNTVINLIMESGAFATDEERSAQILEFLLAGHDTTAYSIAWILLELARNPVEQRQLREELRRMSPEDWVRSGQLKRVVQEGMRLHPVASGGSVRVTGRDITTPRGERIPGGSLCFMPYMLLFRNPDVYAAPDAFRPDRWRAPSREAAGAFTPFALGKQNCVGQSLARAETCAIVARICSEFKLSVEDEGDVTFFLTLKPVGARLRARRV